MPLGSSRPSSMLMITRNWVTMQSRLWGKRAFSVWHGYVNPSFFLSRRFVTLVSNDALIYTRGAYDEGPNGPLHGLRATGGSSKRKG